MGGIGALPFASASVNRSWKRSSACENSLGISQTFVRVTLRDLRQHLEVLVGEQFRVGVSGVDGAEVRRPLPLPRAAQERGARV
jgi:hypothetical protein